MAGSQCDGQRLRDHRQVQHSGNRAGGGRRWLTGRITYMEAFLLANAMRLGTSAGQGEEAWFAGLASRSRPPRQWVTVQTLQRQFSGPVKRVPRCLPCGAPSAAAHKVGVSAGQQLSPQCGKGCVDWYAVRGTTTTEG